MVSRAEVWHFKILWQMYSIRYRYRHHIVTLGGKEALFETFSEICLDLLLHRGLVWNCTHHLEKTCVNTSLCVCAYMYASSVTDILHWDIVSMKLKENTVVRVVWFIVALLFSLHGSPRHLDQRFQFLLSCICQLSVERDVSVTHFATILSPLPWYYQNSEANIMLVLLREWVFPVQLARIVFP